MLEILYDLSFQDLRPLVVVGDSLGPVFELAFPDGGLSRFPFHIGRSENSGGFTVRAMGLL